VSPPAAVAQLGPAAHLWATFVGTARAVVLRYSAYRIELIRAPLFPVLFFLTWRVTYDVAGQREVAGANVPGFLLVGMLGLMTWNATIWSSGYAIEHERQEGTVGALFLSPASRAAVVTGYGLGGFVWSLPSLAVLGGLGLLVGARFAVTDPLAPLAAVAALYLGSLCTGFAFAGLFVLSRRGNLLANFLQVPVWLLAGFLVPRDALPGWLRPLSNAVPASHAVDALRDGALGGATLGEVWTALVAALGASLGFALIGALALRRVEHAAKRAGTLELY